MSINRNIVKRTIACEIQNVCSDGNADPLQVASRVLDAILGDAISRRALASLLYFAEVEPPAPAAPEQHEP